MQFTFTFGSSNYTTRNSKMMKNTESMSEIHTWVSHNLYLIKRFDCKTDLPGKLETYSDQVKLDWEEMMRRNAILKIERDFYKGIGEIPTQERIERHFVSPPIKEEDEDLPAYITPPRKPRKRDLMRLLFSDTEDEREENEKKIIKKRHPNQSPCVIPTQLCE